MRWAGREGEGEAGPAAASRLGLHIPSTAAAQQALGAVHRRPAWRRLARLASAALPRPATHPPSAASSRPLRSLALGQRRGWLLLLCREIVDG